MQNDTWDVISEAIDGVGVGNKGPQFHNVLGDLPPILLEDASDDEEGLCIPWLLNPGTGDCIQQLVCPFRGWEPQSGSMADLVEGPIPGSIQIDAIMVLLLGGNPSMSPLKSV